MIIYDNKIKLAKP